MDRVSRNLALRPHYTMEEYQRWFDHNPDFKHNGDAERIELIEPLSLEGTNQLYRAKLWLQHPRDEKRYDEKEIVVKICKYWAHSGKNRLHRLRSPPESTQEPNSLEAVANKPASKRR